MPTSHLPDNHVQRLLSFGDDNYIRSYLRLFLDVKGNLDSVELEDLIRVNNFDEVIEIVNNRMQFEAQRVLPIADQKEFEGVAETIRDYLDDNHNVVIPQSNVLQRAQLFVRRGENKIREMTLGAVTSIRQIISRDAIGAGMNPNQVARNIIDRVNLTSVQEAWVANYERELRGIGRVSTPSSVPFERAPRFPPGQVRLPDVENRTPRSRLFGRLLRDRRSDSPIRTAINNDEPLEENIIQRLKKRYAERMERLRARTIARTESLRGLHRASDEMYTDAELTGQIDPIDRKWLTARDERVRASHRDLNGLVRRINESFPHGLMYPGDPSAPASETINCRCVLRYLITSVQ